MVVGGITLLPLLLLKSACGFYEFREWYGHFGASQKHFQCELLASFFGLLFQIPSFVRIVGTLEQEMLCCFGFVATCQASGAICFANMVEILVNWDMR